MTSAPKFNCIFCKEVFDNKEDLQVHFRKHGDPTFNIKNRFEIPTQLSNEKNAEKEMVRCDVCSQASPTISKAITHKHKVHPDHDAKYFCPWCGKLFTMKHLYNIHIQTTHKGDEKPEEVGFHCDTCNVDFYLPSAVMYHNKFFHRQDTDIPDVGLSKKVKSINQEVIAIYYCAFCGEEFDNKVNLYKHMTDDHSDENQYPEEVLRCPICEAVFYHLDAYEIHLTFHSHEDMYSATNPLYEDQTDFSLETVPPLVEKVENLEPGPTEDTDPETAMNAVGIERFLELAMDPSNDSNPVKVKKHKKHKKSKKPAITLDEFLSMNTDVFGEDLDIQGVEEIPTRVVKKHLKTNSKRQVKSAKAVTTAELAKLKKQGIVIKKKKNINLTAKALKLTPVKTIKIAQNKINPDIEIKTSNEMLSKLINQSNNQIKIVKKNNTENTLKDSGQTKELVGENSEKYQISETDTENKNGNSINNKDNDESINSQQKNIAESTFPKPPCSSSPVPEKYLSINQNAMTIQANNLKCDISKQLNTNNLNYENINKKNESGPSLSPKSAKSTEECRKERPELNESDQEDYDDNQSDTEHAEESYKDKEPNQYNLQTQAKVISAKDESLSHLKHLSHLITVKPVNKNKNVMETEKIQNMGTDSSINTSSNQNHNNEDFPLPVTKNMETTLVKPQSLPEKNPALGALRNLSKTLTIKSLPKSAKNDVEESTSDNENEDNKEIDNTADDQPMNETAVNKNIMIKRIKVENELKVPDKIINSYRPTAKIVQSGRIPQTLHKPQLELNRSKNYTETIDNTAKRVTDDILKRFPNLTTKPVLAKKDSDISCEQQLNKTTESSIHKEDKKEDVIEIFDVDDSDDEDDMNMKAPEPINKRIPDNNTITSEPIHRKIQQTNVKKPETNHHTSKSVDPLKNLSKHITVKSFNHQPFIKNIKVEKETTPEENHDDDFDDFMDDFDDDDVPINMQNAKIMNVKLCNQKVSNRNMAFNSTLKNLSKNITVKSSNSSPNQSVRPQEFNQQNKYANFEENEASDSDSSSPGNVKITEIDENVSDSEVHSENIKKNNTAMEPIVESPDDSEEEEFVGRDFESEIEVNTVQKCQQNVNPDKNSACLNNLKNINKNLTIKSINSPSDNNSQCQSSQVQEFQQTAVQKKVQNATKSSKQYVKEAADMSSSKNLKVACQVIDQSLNRSMNQKVAGMSQQNTVNKEVTVKTFQTKTVIQEITTTVTKTIKTVNQTVKQEVRNACQTNASIASQKNQGIKPSTSKNLQGVVIKHASPNVAPIKVSNTIAQVRPMATVVRPSNQIVPVRPGLNVVRPSMNVARPSKPRMPRTPVAKPVPPPPTPHSQMIGKTLKISPSAMASKMIKRPNTEEVSGPFSCFKKPKESLIPVSDIPSFASSGETAQFTAASHSSSSNFTSTMKVMKGNAVMTATQMKSEMSTSSQQVSRMSNATGIKVKMAQTNQCQVQEKSETSGMKRTTLEAIQKLQKQGLLIKKPRVENEASADSNHSDDNLDL